MISALLLSGCAEEVEDKTVTVAEAAAVSKVLAVEETPEPAETADPLELTYSENGEITSSVTLSEETLQALRDGIEHIEHEGNRCGFVLLDLNSGNTIMYDPNETFYSASTVKAFFAASLVDQFPELLEEDNEILTELLVNSSNDAYQYLADTYGVEYMQAWFGDAGVSMNTINNMYCKYTPLDAAKIWRYTYDWFNDSEQGEELGELYETPVTSLFHDILKNKCTTRTKAGWIDYDDDFRATSDAGIIYEEDDPYILVLFTDVPSDFEVIKSLGQALIDAHEELIVKGG